MPRKLPKLRSDVNETAYRTVLAAVGETEKPQPPGQRTKKHETAVKRGRKGGKRGGKARGASLTQQERREAAIRAATVRWAGKRS
jgi:aspartate-semialdehyde dehydrogenase